VRVSGSQAASGSLAPSTLAILSGLFVVLVAGFLVLVLTEHDTATYSLFVAGPLVTSVVGAVVARRVRVVEDVARTVESQTNGLLSSNFAGMHDHLDAQTVELLADSEPAPSGRLTAGQQRLARAAGQPAASEAQVRGPIRPSTTRP
jgi:hypothetical protein